MAAKVLREKTQCSTIILLLSENSNKNRPSLKKDSDQLIMKLYIYTYIPAMGKYSLLKRDN